MSELSRPDDSELGGLARRVLEVLDQAGWPMTLFELGPPAFGDDDADEPVSDAQELELIQALTLLEERGLAVSREAHLRDIGLERAWQIPGKSLHG